jgi:hypothetical protein
VRGLLIARRQEQRRAPVGRGACTRRHSAQGRECS